MRAVGTVIVASTLVLLAGAAAVAQSTGAPQPSLEHQKLGYFVGHWKSEGTVKENPFMPAGKMTATDTCKWFEGGFAVVCESEGSGPMGPMKGLGIMGYNGEEKVYIYYGLDNTGMTMTTVPRGTVTGAEWVYDDESTMGGKKIKSRYALTEVSPTEYTFRWLMADEKGAWITLMEGTSRKSK
ncbi:MAG: DUF1579 domain-containing protein [Phycisphaerales bacterium]|nr:DUF1579 domain-containing protein [Phycisphaerales bacterium]